jgi:hypothetical protein
VIAKNIAARPFPDVRELFADADALFCGSGVPAAHGERAPEGVRVTGRWPSVSGCEEAAWASLALMVDGQFSFAVIPVVDLAVDRTWHTAGMRGTGSRTLVAEDVPVPTERVAAARFTVGDLVLYPMTALGSVVGAARSALDVVEAMFASDRKPFMSTYSRMGEPPGPRWSGCSTCTARAASAPRTRPSGSGGTWPSEAATRTSTRTSRSRGTGRHWRPAPKWEQR